MVASLNAGETPHVSAIAAYLDLGTQALHLNDDVLLTLGGVAGSGTYDGEISSNAAQLVINGVTGTDLDIAGTTVAYLRAAGIVARQRIHNDLAVLNIGTSVVTGHGLVAGDCICGGDFEVDGQSFLDGNVRIEGLISGNNAAGPLFANETATSANPTLIPNKVESDTGIGWVSDTLHFIGGGVSLANASPAGLAVPIAKAFLIGPDATNDTWRFVIVAGDLSFQKREAGAWVEKGAFTA